MFVLKSDMVMDDSKKLKMLVWTTGVLCVLAMAFSVASDSFLPEIGSYLERKMYFESVISEKGLSMHKGDYWKKVKE